MSHETEDFATLPAAIAALIHFDPDYPSPARPERAMWRAVITQALMDAGSESRKAEARYHKFEATAWLTGNSRDFNIACDYAGLDPQYVKRMAARAIAGGCKWRAEPEPSLC